MPILSIITINYNNLEGLKKTFKSVFEQTYQDFEYIVIDGGSTDGSKELIEENADRFTYWVSEADKGIYNAMNKGWKKANGEYCLFLNSGDWLYSNTTIINFINQAPNEDIVYGNSIFIDPSGKMAFREFPKKLTFNYFVRDSINHQCIFMKKNILQLLNGFDENYKIVADWATYTIAISKYNVKYKHIDQIICYYDTSGFSLNPSNKKILDKEKQCLIKKHFEIFYDDYIYLDELRKLSYSRLFKLLKKLGLFSTIYINKTN